MSKKKTKTRLEKVVTQHHLSHLENSAIIHVTSDKNVNVNSITAKNEKKPESPLAYFINRDLRASLILIGIFVLFIVVLGIVVYQTGWFNPLLSRWNIKY